MDIATLTFPHINRNGTSARMLARDYSDAALAVERAIEKLSEVEFHSRDYMQQPDGAAIWKQAVEEHTARGAKLRSVAAELRALAEYAADKM